VEPIWVPIVVAVIMGPVVVVLQRLRKKIPNSTMRDAHYYGSLAIKSTKLASKIDGHIGWHDGKKLLRKRTNG
jgi:hypothetical protein